MAVTLTATPEPDQARIAIKAEGGVIGDAFYIGRRGRDGIISLARETSEASQIWERDPAGQRTNLFTRPRFELTAAAQTVFTNLFRNAGFVANEEVNNVIRTNLAPNPGFEENNRIATNGNGAATLELRSGDAHSGSRYVRVKWTKEATWGGAFANTFDVVPGQDYVCSVWVRTNALRKMRIIMVFNGLNADSAGPGIDVRAYNATSNSGWTKLTWSGKAPSGSTTAAPYIQPQTGSRFWSINDWLDVDAMLTERATTFGEYFDGSTGGFEDSVNGRLLTAWSGTPFNSSSYLYPATPYGVTGENAVVRMYQNGVLILPTGTNTASAALVDHGNSMLAGRTYTVAASMEVFQRSGSTHENAGKITVTSKNGTQVLQTDTTEAAEVGSSQMQRLTVTIPAGATAVEVRVWNGAAAGAGRVAFRNLRIFEGGLDYGMFTGNSSDSNEFAYGWSNPITGVASTGASVMTSIPPAGGFTGVGAVAIASTKWKKNGSRSLRLFPTSSNTDSYIVVPTGVLSLAAGKTYTFVGTQRLQNPLTGSLHADSRRVRVTGTGMTKLVSTQPANTLNRQTTFRWTFTVPAGATNVRMELVHGGVFGSGDFFWDEILVVEGTYAGSYFDGEFSNPDAGGWNGTKDASTSFRYSESLPITIYDYEARQGQTMEYFVLDNQGAPITEGMQVQVPEWGTWLKDPFRTYLNTRVYLNSDDTYTRKANRVLMQPRGSRLPIAQWERRTAPEGTLRFLTETPEQARKLTQLVDEAGVVFLDVAEEFGIPFQYAALGDVSGVRAVGEALRAPQRYWDIEMQEVAMPVGAPAAMSATYENLMNTFSSYLALRSSVPDYKAVAAGEWS